jgi:hypothetical protein
MRGDWLFDAVQVEVAYRSEQLQKAGRSTWVGRAGRFGRRFRARKPAEVVVPAQTQLEGGLPRWRPSASPR